LRFAVAGLLVAGMVGLAQAQFRPGGGGGGVTFLVSNKAVQEDLKLSEDQVAKLKEWGTEFRKKSAEIMKDKGVEFGKGGFGKIEPEMREKIDAANAEINKVAYTQLADVLKKEQVERLKQIQRQQMGASAFTNAEVADALKLTAAQKDSVKAVMGDLQKDTKEIMGTVGGGGKGKFDFEKAQENQKKVQKLQKEYVGKLEDLLDDKQKVAWKEMKGAEFDLTKLQFQPRKKD
jgi:DNA-binding transcriptional MerR regulator